MNRWSTSFERSSGEIWRFAIACLGVLMGLSGIIFDQPILGFAGAVVLILAVARPFFRSDTD
jgi:hypothetical protein